MFRHCALSSGGLLSHPVRARDVRHSRAREALALLDDMRRSRVVPSPTTYSLALQAWSLSRGPGLGGLGHARLSQLREGALWAGGSGAIGDAGLSLRSSGATRVCLGACCPNHGPDRHPSPNPEFAIF